MSSGRFSLTVLGLLLLFATAAIAEDLRGSEEFLCSGTTALGCVDGVDDCFEVALRDLNVPRFHSDPFDLAKRAQQQQAQAESAKAKVEAAGKGAGAKGALGGAAAGALVGEIASDDAGGGAAWGAAAGMVIARRRARRKQAEATQQIEQQSREVQKATAEQIEGFKKAFSACLEAKRYVVKI